MRRLPYNRVIVITLLVALLSMAIGLMVLSKVKDQLVHVSTDEYEKQQTLLANQIADTLSGNLLNVQNQLNIMATMPEVKNIADVEQCNSRLGELLKINQRQLGNLARTDTSGRFVCSVNAAIIGQDTARYGSYVHDLIMDPKHNPVMGRITKPTGTESLSTGLHVPVYDGDKFIGTLGGALYFERFQDQYLKSIKFGNSGYVVVMDDNGDILYHPSKSQSGKNLLDPKILTMFSPQDTMSKLVKKVRANESGTFDYALQGKQKIGLFKTIEVPNVAGRHWAVIVTIPVDDIDGVVNKAGINQIFLVLVLLLTFTTGLITFVSLRNTLKALEVQNMKDEFISLTSHQLRTPATIVKQYLGLLKDGYAKSKKDENEFIKAAYESNDTQLAIIENILSVSRLETGRLEISKDTIILQELLNKAGSAIRINMTAKKHKFQLHMPVKQIHLKGDSIKLSMAVENLLSNALKYTPEGGKIDVTLARRKGQAVICVKDNGIGITSGDIPKLFKRFSRLDSSGAPLVPGTGLGLYLAKKIVELHGGTIEVMSTEHKGTTFTIRLPLT